MKKTNREALIVFVLSVIFIVAAILMALTLGCNPQPTPDPTPPPTPDVAERTHWSPLVAVAAAEAVMQGGATPAPLPLPPAPDPDDDSGTKPGGPFSFIRDAKELVEKGNALADRGKSILDKAEAEGKVTFDVHLPGGPKAVPQETKESTAEELGQDCSDGSCSTQGPLRRFFRRRR